jgi:amino acid transporter
MSNSPASATSLKRTLGLATLIAVGVGQVVGQGAAVSILQGVGTNGTAFMAAIAIAFILTLCSIYTFTELALMMPKAGGISTYTEVAIGHFPAIVVTLAGYLGLSIFAGAADMFLLNNIIDVLYPGTFQHFGLLVYLSIAILNLFEVEVFASAQNLLAYAMLAALLVIGVAGVSSAEAQDIPFSSLLDGLGSLNWGVLSLTVLAMWAFMGMEFVCPLVEETKEPEKNLPRAMIVSAYILLSIYGLFALAGYHKVPGPELVHSSIPHWLLIRAIFGEGAKLLMAAVVITAAATSFSSGIAAISRMLHGMAKNNQLPAVFGLLHPRWRSPWFGVVFICGLAVSAYFSFLNAQDVIILLMVSSAALWLVVYIVAHIDLIVLRFRYPDRPRPYRSSWYPFAQILGIIAMVYLIYDNSPSPDMTRAVYLNEALCLGVSGLYAALWIKFRIKRGFFKGEPIEKIH